MNLTGTLIQKAMRANPPLSRDEEQAVVRRAHAGDKTAKDRLVLCNLGIVWSLASKYVRPGLPLDDLIQYGVIGLLRALPKFDPERGHRFSTYACHWIRAALDDGAGMKEPLVRKRADQARNMARGGAIVPVFSLDEPIGDETDVTYLDRLKFAGEAADEDLHRQRRGAAIRARVAATGMDPREREIVHDRLMKDEPETLSELGARHGVTRERIRQLEIRVKERMRRALADLAV